MLQQLRDQTQSLGLRFGCRHYFGFDAVWVRGIFLGAAPKVATVDDYEVTENVLAMESGVTQAITTQMGPVDPADIDRLQLQLLWSS